LQHDDACFWPEADVAFETDLPDAYADMNADMNAE
jgi:hypothetical protein